MIIATHSIEWIEKHADDLALLDQSGEIWTIGAIQYRKNQRPPMDSPYHTYEIDLPD